MKRMKVLNFIYAMLAFIVAKALYNQFDFENLSFKNTGISVIYILTLVFYIYFVVMSYKKRL